MGPTSRADLVVAGLDLQLVRLLRDAIRTADAASGKTSPIAFIGPAPTPPPPQGDGLLSPSPRFEPRPVIHPTPRFEPRPVIHPTPREGPAPLLPPVDGERPRITPSPIEPVWKKLPPVQPDPINNELASKVKVIWRRPDLLSSKGSVLDVFI